MSRIRATGSRPPAAGADRVARGTPLPAALRAAHAPPADPVADIEAVAPVRPAQSAVTAASTVAFVRQRDADPAVRQAPDTHAQAPPRPGPDALAAVSAYDRLTPQAMRPRVRAGAPAWSLPVPRRGSGYAQREQAMMYAHAQHADVDDAWPDWWRWHWWWRPQQALWTDPRGPGANLWAAAALGAMLLLAALLLLFAAAVWQLAGPQRVAVTLVVCPLLVLLAAMAGWFTTHWHRRRR